MPIPADLGEGRYTISIEAIQAERSGLTSRDVLLPFLRNGAFEELEVFCKHVPAWLAMELTSCNYGGHIDRLGAEKMRVVISKNASCGVVPFT